MKNNKVNSVLNIDNENTYLLMCWDIFQKLPNSHAILGMYDKNLFYNIINDIKQEQTITREVIKVEELDIINVSYFIKITDTIYLAYHIQDSENIYTTINEVEFFYKGVEDEPGVKDIIDAIDEASVTFEMEDSINKLNNLISTADGLDIEPIPTELDDNIELFYSSGTFKCVNKIIKSIKNSNKGISILYGERGTGKTSIIPYIADMLDRIVIYIPNNLIDILNSNDFKTFLKAYSKPIIVIDNSEHVFNEVYTKTNPYTNSILELVDGLISDVIGLNVILIANGELEDLDPILLDANSFIDSVEFKYLDAKESKNLSKYLKLDKKYKEETKLINVINGKLQKEYKKIGLK